MSEWEIFQSDYKEYDEAGVAFGAADVKAFGEEAVRALADRMYQVMEERYENLGLDMLYTIVNNMGDDESENMMYMIAYGEGATQTLQEAYENHNRALYFIAKDNLSRKKDIVPAIVDVLKQKQK